MTQETKKHPHDAVIRAWLDGKTIQARLIGTMADVSEWYDCPPVSEHGGMPGFFGDCRYRIKPEDPDIFVDLCGYVFDQEPDFRTVQYRRNSVKMKLSEFKKIAQIED